MENPKEGKSAVIFFSHTGDNYQVGVIKEGNTFLLSRLVSQTTGADMIEIVCSKNYDVPYNEMLRIAKDEQRSGELPAYSIMLNGKKSDKKVDLNAYSSVYVGTPVWWGTFPQVMFSFFQDNNLNGKTIHLFVTHEGSGLGRTADDLERLYPKASIINPCAIYGHEARTKEGQDKILEWLKNK